MPKPESWYVRDIAAKYCVGRGVDVGCGSEKVIPSAIGVDTPEQYGIPGHPRTVATVTCPWLDVARAFIPEQLDFVFSSHLLEDYEDRDLSFYLVTMFDALKRGGIFMVYLPIEAEYKAHCHATGRCYNAVHKQDWPGPEGFLATVTRLVPTAAFAVVESGKGPGPYSFYVVMRKQTRDFLSEPRQPKLDTEAPLG
jgi:predicted SAM-dependent methyltransferase